MSQPTAQSAVPQGYALLTWNDFDGEKLSDPQVAIYVLNGKVMEKGEAGFALVLDAIGKLPRGTQLWIYPDDFVRYAYRRIHLIEDSQFEPLTYYGEGKVPFHRSSILVEQLKRVTSRQDIHVRYLEDTPTTRFFEPEESPGISESERFHWWRYLEDDREWWRRVKSENEIKRTKLNGTEN